jgi:hypothetical protein
LTIYKPATVLGDLNVSTKAENGLSIKSDSNKLCFGGGNSNCIDFNGTAFVIGG